MDNTVQPVLGIIIPCYNHGKYLQECINSILTQGYPRVDIAIVDNGSSDNSAEIAKKFEGVSPKGVIRVCSTKDRLGAAGARNKGIELLGHCDYFMFLDADDILENNVITPMVEILYNLSDVSLVYGDYSNFYDGTDISWREYKEPYSRDRVEQECFINTPMVKKQALARVGLFDTELDGQEDFDMWIRLTEVGLGYHLPISIVKVRHANENTYDRVSPNKYRAGMERIYNKLQQRKSGMGVI